MTIEDFEKYDGKAPTRKSCCTPVNSHTDHMGAVEHTPQEAGAYGHGYGWDMYDGEDDYYRHVGADSVRTMPGRDFYGFPLDKVKVIQSGTSREK